MATSIAGHACL